MTGRFDPRVLVGDPEHRTALLDVLDTALAAADPAGAVGRCLHRDGPVIAVGGHEVEIRGRVVILAFGKAAPAMAGAALTVLDGLPVTGVVAAPSGDGPGPLRRIAAGHPVPTDASERAGRALLAEARAAGPDDVVIALVSGGGSAIAEVPAPGLAIADLAATTEVLLRSGADIEEVNTVRRHLSAFKGGRLAEAAAPARLVTLLLSDVAGGRPEAIASGPTIADPTTYRDALRIATRRASRVPGRVLAHLEAGVAGEIPESPSGGAVFDGQIVRVVADGAVAAEAAAARAAALGIAARVAGTDLAGEAHRAGADVAGAALAPGGPGMLIWSGETTVTVTGEGLGGRNQEVALGAAVILDGTPGTLVASLGTDGVDGPTEAAGAVGDGGTVARGAQRGMDANASLARNDSHTFLRATGDLLVTGPTGTNVGDLVVAWRWM